MNLIERIKEKKRENQKNKFEKRIKLMLLHIFKKDTEAKKNQNMPIEDCNFSVRAYHCLKWAGINKLGDIKSVEQLIKVRNLGRECCQEVMDKLHEYGIEIMGEV